jgi:hypothetical protein
MPLVPRGGGTAADDAVYIPEVGISNGSIWKETWLQTIAGEIFLTAMRNTFYFLSKFCYENLL